MKLYPREFALLAREIVNNEEYQKMKSIKHHHESVYKHSVSTAYMSYNLAKRLNLDYISITRGCLLHDFFLYKFKRGKGLRIISAPFIHMRKHPLIALENALRHFSLNSKECNIIRSHMFPVGLPKSREAWIVTFVDKFSATIEYSIRAKRRLMANLFS
ncbi:MAG: HD domain-containing protein [Peptostreptococcales bacterium]